jgi:hypothetical protein
MGFSVSPFSTIARRRCSFLRVAVFCGCDPLAQDRGMRRLQRLRREHGDVRFHAHVSQLVLVTTLVVREFGIMTTMVSCREGAAPPPARAYRSGWRAAHCRREGAARRPGS